MGTYLKILKRQPNRDIATEPLWNALCCNYDMEDIMCYFIYSIFLFHHFQFLPPKVMFKSHFQCQIQRKFKVKMLSIVQYKTWMGLL